MDGIHFYRENALPFEIKVCDTTSDLSYKKHSHEEYSLGIVNEGRSSFWCKGKMVEIHQRSLVFIPHNVVHACNPHCDKKWKYKMIYIQPYWVKEFMENKNLSPVEYPIVKELSSPKLYSKVNSLMQDLVSPVSPLEKESILLAVFEQAIGDIQPEESLYYRNLQPKVKTIKEYLDSHFLEKITLDKLEEVSGLSKFYIIRAFKEECSIPPHTYQTLLRVNYAKRELQKNRAITEVAYEAGFYDQSHFHKIFKSHVGVTPDQYKK